MYSLQNMSDTSIEINNVGDNILHSFISGVWVCTPIRCWVVSQYTIMGTNVKNATKIILPKNFRSIGRCAFYKCSKLTSIIMHTSVTSIGENAFRGCSALSSVNIPPQCYKYWKWCFQMMQHP